ncbi:SPP1 family predicted phage head-tail adaptor [Psychrobacillus insolitus]|uniref:SPP1 family predicted phage head-tail adaptor n=1 Tax=Psychrobacillus insolitus TaxID=1461 RepID=A0A2W7MKP6_9BACI|nr:phage head closure protein [Psychrobacillus insolitus]PZX07902.1 SPP1 family predicted phage head-tail adaptor [Psychrobacillus insolitus]
MDNEFPHEVSILQLIPGEDDGFGGTGKATWDIYETIEAFVDTPSSREIYNAMQRQNPLDRFMYYAYRKDVLQTMRVKHDGDLYEIASKPEDQGGQNEVMRIALKLVNP